MVVTSYASESRFPCIDLEFLNIIAYSWLLHSSQLSGDITENLWEMSEIRLLAVIREFIIDSLSSLFCKLR